MTFEVVTWLAIGGTALLALFAFMWLLTALMRD